MGKKGTWYILHIILNGICKFAITRKKDAFFAKVANTRLTKIWMAIFALAERLPTSATLQRRSVLFSQSALVFVWVFGDAKKSHAAIKLAEWGLQYFVEHFGTELGTTNRLFPEECEGPHSGGGQHTPNSIEHHHHHVLPIFWGKSNFLPGYGKRF